MGVAVLNETSSGFPNESVSNSGQLVLCVLAPAIHLGEHVPRLQAKKPSATWLPTNDVVIYAKVQRLTKGDNPQRNLRPGRQMLQRCGVGAEPTSGRCSTKSPETCSGNSVLDTDDVHGHTWYGVQTGHG